MVVIPENYSLYKHIDLSHKNLVNSLVKNENIELIIVSQIINWLSSEIGFTVLLNGNKLVFIYSNVDINTFDDLIAKEDILHQISEAFLNKIKYQISLRRSLKNFIDNHIEIMLYLPSLEKDSFSKQVKYKNYIFRNSNSTWLKKQDSNPLHTCNCIENVISLVAPEYTISTIQNSSDVDISQNYEKLRINENEYYIKNILLDNEQIEIINNMKTGNYLIKACAGSGKSVILMAKALKYANTFSEQNILLTCYNKNLNEYYKWKKEISGTNFDNLYISTFHSLVFSLLTELEQSIDFSELKDDSVMEEKINYIIQNLDRLKTRFLAVFIDEIQMMKPYWYELCYRLLKSSDKDKYHLVIAGDISQSLNKAIKQGKAVWRSERDLPMYTGRTISLDKNYRNSKEISRFIKTFSKGIRNIYDELQIKLDDSLDELYLGGKTFNNGYKPIRVLFNSKTDKYSSKEEAKKVVKVLKLEKEKYGFNYSDIAIITPYRKYNNFSSLFADLKAELDANGITYEDISSSSEHFSYCDWNGVKLSTIDSVLGLDFKVVFLVGLSTLGLHKRSYDKVRLLTRNVDITEDFVMHINKLYTAISRSKERLVIFLERKEDNVYFELLFPKKKRGKYNDK